jgi:hypothetical protein
VSYTATASGFGSVTGTVNLAPSGFVIGSPTVGTSSVLTTSASPNSPVEIRPAIASSGVVQAIRGGFSANVGVTSSNTTVGTITISPVTISNGADVAQTEFDPATSGTANVSLTPPAPFVAAAVNNSLAVTVLGASISIDPATNVGKNLQFFGTALFGAPAPAGGLDVTVTVTAGQLQLATTATGASASSITINIPAGQSNTHYYLRALADTGTATYTVSAPGFAPKSGTVFLSPSGIVVSGPFGFGQQLLTTLGLGAQPVTLNTAVLEPGTNIPMAIQPLAAGMTAVGPFSNTTPAVGTVPASATITAGNDNVVVQFTPLSVGQTTISITQPAGFSLPSTYTSVVARVI